MEKIMIEEIRASYAKLANLNWKEGENFDYYLLNRDYIEKLEPFFDEIEDSILNKDIFIRNSLQFNLDSYDRGGFFIGVFDKEKVIAVMILDSYHNDKSLPNYMNIKQDDRYNSIIFDTICVLPGYRGYSLQEKMMCLGEYICLSRRYKYAFMSISPYNYYSLLNAFKQDFTIFAIKSLYATNDSTGVSRYILVKPLGKVLSDVKEQYSVANSDIKMQEEVIALGFSGMKLVNFESQEKFFVSYSKAFYD